MLTWAHVWLELPQAHVSQFNQVQVGEDFSPMPT